MEKDEVQTLKMLVRRIWTGGGRSRARGGWMTARNVGGRKPEVMKELKSQRPEGGAGVNAETLGI